MMEFIDKYIFSSIAQTLLLSALTAIFFSGGTNFLLQKTNRKGNLLSDKGLLFIGKIIDMEEARIEAMKYCTVFIGFTDEEYLLAYSNYSKELSEFTKFVKVHNFLLTKSTKSKLHDYLDYLNQPQEGIMIMMNKETTSFIIDFNNSKSEELSEEIITQIKKQMI